MYKQVIILRKDLGMSAGKLCVQAAHASINAFEKADSNTVEKWKREGMEKVCLKVSSEKKLKDIYNRAKKLRHPVSLIRDAGRTQIPAGSPTAVAIGPAKEQDVDEITGKLKLL